MTFGDRAAAVMKLGFTERQGRFLAAVALHSGVCMVRHYCVFAGIRHGQKTHNFFAGLVHWRFATVYQCVHGRARLFHLHRRSLYEAIGEPDSRFRRLTPIVRAIERMMVLDAVLATRDVTWLATAEEKVIHFTHLLHARIERQELPHLTFGRGDGKARRYFPDKLPIGVQSDTGTHVFTNLVARAVPVDFRPFLDRHAGLLRALPRWTIRLCSFPAHLADTVGLEQRSTASDGIDRTRYARAREAFGAPQYRVLYRTWVRQGAGVLRASSRRSSRTRSLEGPGSRVAGVGTSLPASRFAGDNGITGPRRGTTAETTARV